MVKDISAEYERLKKDFFEAERTNQETKASLLKVINTFGNVVAMHPEFEEELRAIKTMVSANETAASDLIDNEVGKLRSKIFAKETERGVREEDDANALNELSERLLAACRVVKRIAVALGDDFYPLSDELKAKAEAIRIDCHKEMARDGLDEAASDLLRFIRELRTKIAKDFKHVNGTFMMLFEQVKELEKDLTEEFDQNSRQKEIEQFETQVNHKVGSIVDVLDIHATIDEMRHAVVEKLSSLKQLLSERKEQEMQRIQKAFGVISNLKKRISEAEKGAQEMNKKAKHFQRVAQKDGLTGLFNRNAFDGRIKDALKSFSAGGEPVSLVLFDVDNFKWINDTFGHVAGDKVLQKVAQSLRSTFRKNDFIARLGGDEFAVVIEGLSEEMARSRISEFDKNFRQKKFVSRNLGEIHVTLSAGIAKALDGERPDEILHRADMDMYECKRKQIKP